MFEPKDFDSANYGISWPAILAVFAVQMVVLIALIAIAVANHSSFAAASSTEVEAKPLKR